MVEGRAPTGNRRKAQRLIRGEIVECAGDRSYLFDFSYVALPSPKGRPRPVKGSANTN